MGRRGRPRRLLVCRVCGAELTTTFNLNRHVRYFHGTDPMESKKGGPPDDKEHGDPMWSGRSGQKDRCKAPLSRIHHPSHGKVRRSEPPCRSAPASGGDRSRPITLAETGVRAVRRRDRSISRPRSGEGRRQRSTSPAAEFAATKGSPPRPTSDRPVAVPSMRLAAGERPATPSASVGAPPEEPYWSLGPVGSRPSSDFLDCSTPYHVSFEQSDIGSDGEPEHAAEEPVVAAARGVRAGKTADDAAVVVGQAVASTSGKDVGPEIPAASSAGTAEGPTSATAEGGAHSGPVLQDISPARREAPTATTSSERASERGESGPHDLSTRGTVPRLGLPLDVTAIMFYLRELPNLELSSLARWIAHQRRMSRADAEEAYRDLQLAFGGQRALASRLHVVISAMAFGAASADDILRELDRVLNEVLARTD